jgi:hypothetical protein
LVQSGRALALGTLAFNDEILDGQRTAPWKDGLITPTFRQPFDMLAVAVAKNPPSETPSDVASAKNEKWLPGMDSNHDSRLQRPLSYH